MFFGETCWPSNLECHSESSSIGGVEHLKWRLITMASSLLYRYEVTWQKNLGGRRFGSTKWSWRIWRFVWKLGMPRFFPMADAMKWSIPFDCILWHPGIHHSCRLGPECMRSNKVKASRSPSGMAYMASVCHAVSRSCNPCPLIFPSPSLPISSAPMVIPTMTVRHHLPGSRQHPRRWGGASQLTGLHVPPTSNPSKSEGFQL